jgi:hypothetical protein
MAFGDLRTRLVSPWSGLAQRMSWRRRRRGEGAVVLTGRAIRVPFRARCHRFATVNHGQPRSSDLRRPYYRCSAARMVRMSSCRPSTWVRSSGLEDTATAAPTESGYPANAHPRSDWMAAEAQRPA